MTAELKKWLTEHAPESDVNLNEPVMSIGVAANIAGLSESALRKYETAGLIIFHRTSTRRRVLSLEDLERVKIIQGLIRNKGLNLEGILRLWTLIPCWDLKKCSSEIRSNCKAVDDSTRPCWVLMRNSGCDNQSDCRTCEVYRFGAYCTEDIKALIRKASKV